MTATFLNFLFAFPGLLSLTSEPESLDVEEAETSCKATNQTNISTFCFKIKSQFIYGTLSSTQKESLLITDVIKVFSFYHLRSLK